jgi:hypothetical protein
MAAPQPEISNYTLSPLPDGGWRAECVEVLPGGEAPHQWTEFPADWITDPTGEVAYAKALECINDWRRQSPARDRRTDHERRQAITWLRLCEAKAADHLPDDLMREITSAIDGVVGLLLPRLRAGER